MYYNSHYLIHEHLFYVHIIQSLACRIDIPLTTLVDSLIWLLLKSNDRLGDKG